MEVSFLSQILPILADTECPTGGARARTKYKPHAERVIVPSTKDVSVTDIFRATFERVGVRSRPDGEVYDHDAFMGWAAHKGVPQDEMFTSPDDRPPRDPKIFGAVDKKFELIKAHSDSVGDGQSMSFRNPPDIATTEIPVMALLRRLLPAGSLYDALMYYHSEPPPTVAMTSAMASAAYMDLIDLCKYNRQLTGTRFPYPLSYTSAFVVTGPLAHVYSGKMFFRSYDDTHKLAFCNGGAARLGLMWLILSGAGCVDVDDVLMRAPLDGEFGLNRLNAQFDAIDNMLSAGKPDLMPLAQFTGFCKAFKQIENNLRVLLPCAQEHTAKEAAVSMNKHVWQSVSDLSFSVVRCNAGARSDTLLALCRFYGEFGATPPTPVESFLMTVSQHPWVVAATSLGQILATFCKLNVGYVTMEILWAVGIGIAYMTEGKWPAGISNGASQPFSIGSGTGPADWRGAGAVSTLLSSKLYDEINECNRIALFNLLEKLFGRSFSTQAEARKVPPLFGCATGGSYKLIGNIVAFATTCFTKEGLMQTAKDHTLNGPVDGALNEQAIYACTLLVCVPHLEKKNGQDHPAYVEKPQVFLPYLVCYLFFTPGKYVLHFFVVYCACGRDDPFLRPRDVGHERTTAQVVRLGAVVDGWHRR